jgi:hypothetical protein
LADDEALHGFDSHTEDDGGGLGQHTQAWEKREDTNYLLLVTEPIRFEKF